MTTDQVAKKLQGVDDFRQDVAAGSLHKDDADTLNYVISSWEMDICRAYLDLPADEHHFRSVKLAHCLARHSLSDIKKAAIATRLRRVTAELEAAIRRMRKNLTEPDLTCVIAAAGVLAQNGTHES